MKDDLFLAIQSLDIFEPIFGFIFGIQHTLKGARSPRGNRRALGTSRIKIARGQAGMHGDAAEKELNSVGVPISGRTTRKKYFSFLVPSSQHDWAVYALSNAGFTVIGDEHNAGKLNGAIRKWRDRPRGRQRMSNMLRKQRKTRD